MLLRVIPGVSRGRRTRACVCPLRRGRVQTEHIKHGANQDLLAFNGLGITICQGNIAQLELFVDCGKGARNIEVVIHCLSEGFGEFFGAQEQLLRACFTDGLDRTSDKSRELFPCCVRIREGIRPPLDSAAVVHG